MRTHETRIFAVGLAVTFIPAVLSSRAAPGDVDTSFVPGFGIDGSVYAIAIQSDGRLVLGGSLRGNAGDFGPSIIRLNTDGSPDATFSPGIGADGDVQSVAVQDGKVLIGGYFGSVSMPDKGVRDGSGMNNGILPPAGFVSFRRVACAR